MTEEKKQLHFKTKSDTIRIIYTSDLHEQLEDYDRFLRRAKVEDADFLFILGDIASFSVKYLKMPEIIQESYNVLKKVFDTAYEALKIPIFYILGNHEDEQAVYETNNIIFVNNDKEIIINDTYQLLGSCGAVSSLKFIGNKYQVLKGYPYDTMTDIANLIDDKLFYKNQTDYLKAFMSFERRQIHYRILQKELSTVQQYDCLNWQKQYDQLEEQISKNKEYKQIILAHQGPIRSLTTFFRSTHAVAASGSEQLQNYFDKYKERIAAFLHGHTHANLSDFDLKKVFGGAMYHMGKFGVLTV